MKHLIRQVKLISVIAFLVILNGCTIQGVRLNRTAQVYIEFGEHEQALEVLGQSLDADFENPATHYWMGHCYQALDNLEKAVYEYRLAVRFDPSLEIAQLALINTLYDDNQLEQSLHAARSFLQQKNDPARDFYRIAQLFAQRNMTPHVILTYQQAQRANPHDPEPSLQLADFHFDQNQQEQGVESLIQAFKIDPLYPGIARRLGEYKYRVQIPRPEPFGPPPTELEKKLRELN